MQAVSVRLYTGDAVFLELIMEASLPDKHSNMMWVTPAELGFVFTDDCLMPEVEIDADVSIKTFSRKLRGPHAEYEFHVFIDPPDDINMYAYFRE